MPSIPVLMQYLSILSLILISLNFHQVHLSCGHSGSASPLTRWFFQGKEATWVNQAALYGRSQLKIEAVKPEDSGNYTCSVPEFGLSASLEIIIQQESECYVNTTSH